MKFPKPALKKKLTQSPKEEQRKDGDMSSVDDDPSTNDSTRGPSADQERKNEPDIGGREDRAVKCTKRLVYLALFICAAASAIAVWIFVRDEEQQEFEDDFESFAQDIIISAQQNFDTIFRQLHGMAATTTSYILATKQTWPFVVIADFERRTFETSGLVAPDMIVFSPIVDQTLRDKWNDFTMMNRNWTIQNFEHTEDSGAEHGIRSFEIGGVPSSDFSVPVWQYGPGVEDPSLINADLYSNIPFKNGIDDVMHYEEPAFADIEDSKIIMGYTEQTKNVNEEPQALFLQPVHRDFETDSPIVALLMAVEPWTKVFKNVLPSGMNGFVVGVKGSCSSDKTFVINGPAIEFWAEGDKHDTKYDSLAVTSTLVSSKLREGRESCSYTLSVYPSDSFEQEYYTSKPYIYSVFVLAMFIFTSIIFVLYDTFVKRRQAKILSTATRTTKIVTSLFPEQVGKRLIEQAQWDEENANDKKKNTPFLAKSHLKQYLDGETADRDFTADPIADFFSETTIMFADICGFTAWSSTREPKHVFALLESVFHEFDMIAKKRRVFKVETVGDCYVAVAGLPEVRQDHAVVMARFARDCLFRFRYVSKKLEVQLGPSTADLGVRIGLHSGPVTAGVLRGEKARFQLFGDTMNTASRIETTGKANRVHVSQETYELLHEAGKGHWLQARVEKVEAKGKGQLKTYWLDLKNTAEGKEESVNTSECDQELPNDVGSDDQASAEVVVLDEKTSRLVKWNVDILSRYLKQIVARRQACGFKCDPFHRLRTAEVLDRRMEGTVLEHAKDIISMPHYNDMAERRRIDPESIKLGDEVEQQLLKYVQTMAAMYRDNPFHNFEHATHVTMSVVKLLNRIVAPDLGEKSVNTRSVHDHTYGITSDPLTSFAVILAALLHDVDHQGVSNAQLVAENAVIAAVYKNKSVAEQNSFSLGWSLLLEEEYTALRHTIYGTTAEFHRFKELLVNTILATDIMDKDLGTARKQRWQAAFSEQAPAVDPDDVTKNENRKATIVIEHLIQASDVAHTMQHWQIYRKWNARLFNEMHRAYKNGRSSVDPSTFWAKGEIGFLDNYVIPLAKKLKNCGVFGVSSDEYLNYAVQNRKLWVDKGEEIVEQLVAAAVEEIEDERVVAKN